jgi:hypothetical protein
MEANINAQLRLFQERYNKLHQELLNSEYENIVKNEVIADLTRELQELKNNGKQDIE